LPKTIRFLAANISQQDESKRRSHIPVKKRENICRP
jgi:hypothetical protein